MSFLKSTLAPQLQIFLSLYQLFLPALLYCAGQLYPSKNTYPNIPECIYLYNLSSLGCSCFPPPRQINYFPDEVKLRNIGIAFAPVSFRFMTISSHWHTDHYIPHWEIEKQPLYIEQMLLYRKFFHFPPPFISRPAQPNIIRPQLCALLVQFFPRLNPLDLFKAAATQADIRFTLLYSIAYCFKKTNAVDSGSLFLYENAKILLLSSFYLFLPHLQPAIGPACRIYASCFWEVSLSPVH